jgi:hypothetical protein
MTKTTELPWALRWLDDLEGADRKLRIFAVGVRLAMVVYIVLHICGVLP